LIDPAEIQIVDFTEQTTIRLISTAYIDEPALSPLADDDDDLNILEDIETMTSPRHNTLVAVPPGVSPDELLTEIHGPGWTYVNAAFCYTRSTGNRFNSVKRGAWYATYGDNAAETSQAEVAYHLTNELDNVGIYENITAYRELLAGFTTKFHNLNDIGKQEFLQPDSKTAYPAGQALAESILRSGGNGLLYPSTRYSNGCCLAAFRPHIIQNIRHGNTWQFEWNGNRQPIIVKLQPNF